MLYLIPQRSAHGSPSIIACCKCAITCNRKCWVKTQCTYLTADLPKQWVRFKSLNATFIFAKIFFHKDRSLGFLCSLVGLIFVVSSRHKDFVFKVQRISPVRSNTWIKGCLVEMTLWDERFRPLFSSVPFRRCWGNRECAARSMLHL